MDEYEGWWVNNMSTYDSVYDNPRWVEHNGAGRVAFFGTGYGNGFGSGFGWGEGNGESKPVTSFREDL